MAELKYKKCKDGSFVHNCFIKRRKDEPNALLFCQTDYSITVLLNGYAVVPLEEYLILTGNEFDSSNIKEADKQLKDQ